MNPETIASLQTLEKELERLRAAVDHIDQAKTVAQKVLGAIAGVQKKYSEHLDALLEVQKSMAAQLSSDARSGLDEAGANARRHILDAAARAKKHIEEHDAEMKRLLAEAGISASEKLVEMSGKFDELVKGSGDAMNQRIEAVGIEVGKHVGELASQVRQQINELATRAARLMDEAGGHSTRQTEEFGSVARAQVVEIGARAHKHIEELGSKSSKHVDHIAELAKTGINEAVVDVKRALEEVSSQSIRIFAAIKKTHDQQTTDFEKLSVSTDAVIASAGKLVRTIDNIDFPERLQTIASDIRSLHFNLNGAMSRIDGLEKAMEVSMRHITDELAAKLSRLEMFTEKTVRTLEENVERQFREHREQANTTKILLIFVLVISLLLGAGLYMIWNDRQGAHVPDLQPTRLPDSVVVEQQTE